MMMSIAGSIAVVVKSNNVPTRGAGQSIGEMAAPNSAPRLFIISSAEALDVTWEIQKGLDRDVLITVWSNGVLFAGGYSLEVLEKAVADSDFAVAIAQPDDMVAPTPAYVDHVGGCRDTQPRCWLSYNLK